MTYVWHRIYSHIYVQLNVMDLWSLAIWWKYRLFALTDNAQSFTVVAPGAIEHNRGLHARCLFLLCRSRRSERWVVLLLLFVQSLDKITAEWIVLHSLSHIYTRGHTHTTNALVIYVASRAWTNNTSLRSRAPSLLVFESRLFTARDISFQTFSAHENTIRAEEPVLPTR